MYGTLASEALREALTGVRGRARPALLEAHARVRVRGEACPAARFCPGVRIEGHVVDRMPRGCLRSLDAFEGSEYRRVVRRVRTEAGSGRLASCRRRADGRGLLERPWDSDAFRRDDGDDYLLRCRLGRAFRRGALGQGARRHGRRLRNT
ncbi:MAG: gamma-glutamylcyclotransferase [Pseudomonadales bacterium]|nr:gamma-glutamylcyclotransferase [Pseudomonadales bacterium]